jgi:ribose/xylose/arabinose/galactoside ABC-type transport system permease subunit
MDQDQFNMFLGKYGIGLILIVAVIIIAIIKPMFIKPNNLLNIFTQISINGLISYGLCLAITTGGIDLSVGAQLALVSCILGQLVGVRGMSLLPACIIAVAVAGLFGFLNGVLISTLICSRSLSPCPPS